LQPSSLPESLVPLLALAPPVVAGLILFRERALILLVVALVAGLVGVGISRAVLPQTSLLPLVAALVATVLIGPGAWPPVVALVALLAVALELVRSRLAPLAAVQPGLLAYAAAYLAAGRVVAAYIDPASHAPALEPIAQWVQRIGSGAATDPTLLYTGQVPGPVFATCLLAVLLAAAWSWYAGSVSLLVAAGFLAGSAALALAYQWPVGFFLESGPTWLVAALILGCRPSTPAPVWGRLVLGAAAGALAMVLHSRGLGVESVALAAALLQLVHVIAQLASGLRQAGADERLPPRRMSPPELPPLRRAGSGARLGDGRRNSAQGGSRWNQNSGPPRTMN
jgi:hypothetical protein